MTGQIHVHILCGIMCLLHLHVRIQEFLPSVCVGGVVEGLGQPDSKKPGQRCFVIFAVF